jgi:hypothetical protein
MPKTKDQNLTDLGDFFSLISGEKKKKEEEYKSLIGDLGSVLSELDEVAKTKVKKEKKKPKKQPKKIEEPKIDVNSLFDELASLKKKEDEKRKKEEKEIKAFESWLFTEPIEVKEEIVETPEEPEEVVLEEEPAAIEEPEETEQVVKQEEISEEVEEKPELEEEPEEEENTTVSQVLEALKTIIKDESVVEEKNNEIDSLKKEVRDLRNLLYQGLRDISAQGGGGEVRLEFLDDVDRDSAKVDSKFLKYEAASGKWVGATGGSGSGTQDLETTLHLGNTSNIGMSVGVVTTTELMVTGDAKVVGVLTVGSSSLTLDGDNNQVQVGSALTLGHDIGLQFHEQFLHVNGFEINNVNASGIITATTFDGTFIGNMDFGEFV